MKPSLSPLLEPPIQMLYLPGPLPTKASSARYGLEHPLGHPVMRMEMSSSHSPSSFNCGSSSSTSFGSSLSESVRACGQNGRLVQAEELRLSPESLGEKIVLPNDGFDLLGSIRCDAVNDQILIACDEKNLLDEWKLFHEKRF